MTVGALPSPSLRCIHRSARASLYGFSLCGVCLVWAEGAGPWSAQEREMFPALKVMNRAGHACVVGKGLWRLPLQETAGELMGWVALLCPAVWCSFVLVAPGIEVPSSRTDCASAASGCTEGGFTCGCDCGEQLCYWVSLELRSFNLCGHSQLKPEMKHEIRGLSIWHLIEVQGLEHSAWWALCSPHFSVNVSWYCPK